MNFEYMYHDNEANNENKFELYHQTLGKGFLHVVDEGIKITFEQSTENLKLTWNYLRCVGSHKETINFQWYDIENKKWVMECKTSESKEIEEMIYNTNLKFSKTKQNIKTFLHTENSLI